MRAPRAADRHGGRVLLEPVLALLAGVGSFALTAVLGTAARFRLPEVLFGFLLLVGVAVFARWAGILVGLPVGVAAVLAFDWYFLPPLRAFDGDTVLVLGTFLIMSVLVGEATTRASRRAISSERARGALATEQGALRRVATLVARQSAPEEVFRAVAEEAGHLLDVDIAQLFAVEEGQTALLVGTWSRSSGTQRPPHSRLGLDGDSVVVRAFRRERPTRVDDCSSGEGSTADYVRSLGICAAVAAPVVVEGAIWGVMTAASLRREPLSAGAEARIAAFAELVATAVANAQARLELRGFAEEQAALRRVATLVARATSPEEVFAAVAEEIGRLLKVDFTILNRCEPDGAHVSVGSWSGTDKAVPFPVGTRVRLGRNVVSLVVQTGRPARIDECTEASGPVAAAARGWRLRAAVGVPISVEGRLWGVITVATGQEQPLPPDTEARLATFTQLVATAIANAQARLELRGHAEEQAALRRVATLVARSAPPEEVFTAVTAEVGRVLGSDYSAISRYDPDGLVTVMGDWSRTGSTPPVPVGSRLLLGGRNVTTQVFETGRPARMDDYDDASGVFGNEARGWGFGAALGVPISVADRLWGVVSVASARAGRLPSHTEGQLAAFTELVATAIANAEARAALMASRARIVAAADTTRRRMERDLHDGAQQRLVSLALHLRGTVRAAVPPGADELKGHLDEAAAEIGGLVDELRELARGLHPAALAEGGLRSALKTLARRSAVPVRLDVKADERFPEQVELAVYYVVAEALTNAAKHASASVVDVQVETGDGVLRVRIRDDGRGGADPSGGSGLLGLTDRVEALGGRLAVRSPLGVGTTLDIELPVPVASPRGSAAAPAPGIRDDAAAPTGALS